jgi:hypothetical protein
VREHHGNLWRMQNIYARFYHQLENYAEMLHMEIISRYIKIKEAIRDIAEIVSEEGMV